METPFAAALTCVGVMCCEDKTRTTQARGELCHQGSGLLICRFVGVPQAGFDPLKWRMLYAGEEQTALATTDLALLMGLSLTSRAWAAGHEQDQDDADEHGRHYHSEHG